MDRNKVKSIHKLLRANLTGLAKCNELAKHNL